MIEVAAPSCEGARNKSAQGTLGAVEDVVSKWLSLCVVCGALLSFGVAHAAPPVAAQAPQAAPEVEDTERSPEGEAGARAFAPEEEISMGRKRRRRSSSSPRKRSTRKKTRRRRRRSRRSARASKTVAVPVDLGIAPTFNFITGPVQSDQLFHTGLRFNLEAVIDNAMIRQNINRVPRSYRKRALKMTEFRMDVRPWYVPQTLVISPKIGNSDTGIYGVGFSPLGIGLALTPSPVRLSVGASAVLKYMFIHSDTLESPTHFLRPGVEVNADFEFPIVPKVFYLSLGWASQVYIPQKVGALPWEGTISLDESIWHVGQAYLMAHIRFPYNKTM